MGYRAEAQDMISDENICSIPLDELRRQIHTTETIEDEVPIDCIKRFDKISTLMVILLGPLFR